MFDQNAELEENRQLDKILDVLANQTSEDEDDSDDDLSDSSELHMDTQDETYSAYLIQSANYFKPLQQLSIPLSDVNKLASLSNLFQHISFEEFNTITDCKDPLLKEIMILNRAKHVQLKTLINKYKEMLSQCEKSLEYHYRNAHKINPIIKGRSRINKCGFPYFHQGESFPANNADYFTKKSENIINLCYMEKDMRWSLNKVHKLRMSVICNYHTNYHTGSNKVEKDKFTALLKNLKDYWNNVVPPKFYDDTFINWEFIAEKYFKDPTCYLSLRAMWNNYVHPGLNTFDFKKHETDLIMSYVKERESVDWIKLVRVLDTNRSEHQLCCYYQTIVQAQKAPTIRDFEESIIEPNDDKIIGWKPTWQHFPASGNVKLAKRLVLRQKYIKSLENCKTGQFSGPEDLKIMSLVKKFGVDFDKISEYMPNRQKCQIKCRYENYLSRELLSFGNFKLEEDEEILRHVEEHGEKNWARLANILPRNVGQLRHRYFRLKKYLNANPDADLRTPIRNGGYEHFAQRQQRLKKYVKVIDNNDIDVMANMAIRRWRMQSEMDDQLVQFFSSTAHLKKTRTLRQINENHLKTCTNSIETILSMFNVTLKLPQNFENIRSLDKVDIEVLNELKADLTPEDNMVLYKPPATQVADIYMPPNVSSTQALRYLLLQTFNSDIAINRISVEMSKGLLLFKDRFKTFFKIPALMSIIEPPSNLRLYVHVKEKHKVAPVPLKRTVGRPKKNLTKIHLMNKARKGKTVDSNSEDASVSDLPEPLTQLATPSKSDVELKRPNDQPCTSAIPAANNGQFRVGSHIAPRKVLIKLDKKTIEELKKQNRLVRVKHISELKENVTIVEKETMPLPIDSIINLKNESDETTVSNTGKRIKGEDEKHQKVKRFKKS